MIPDAAGIRVEELGLFTDMYQLTMASKPLSSTPSTCKPSSPPKPRAVCKRPRGGSWSILPCAAPTAPTPA